MANEEAVHVALPKLYGAPAYARPPALVPYHADRPFDLDELPLDSVQTDEERETIRRLAAHPYYGAAPSDQLGAGREGSPLLRGRPFRLRAIARRLRGDNNGHSSGNGTNGTGR